MKIKSFFIFYVLISSLYYPQTAGEIISKAEDIIKGKTCKGTFEMTVVTPDYTREMKMDSWWIGNDKALIVILSPKREEGNKTLKVGNEMWSYLKNTETTIKIPPSMMLQSWNGSDFTNDDLVREANLAKDYNQKIIDEEVINNEKCWKIELTPKPDAPVVWGKLYYWVRMADYLPSVVQYYDEKGKLIRYMVYSDIKDFNGRKLPSEWTMYNEAKPGHKTQFKILNVRYDIKISDRVFSFQELERGNY